MFYMHRKSLGTVGSNELRDKAKYWSKDSGVLLFLGTIMSDGFRLPYSCSRSNGYFGGMSFLCRAVAVILLFFVVCVGAEECNRTAAKIYPIDGLILPPEHGVCEAGWDWDVTKSVIQPRYECPDPDQCVSATPTPYLNVRLVPVSSSATLKWAGAVYHRRRVWSCPLSETSIAVFDPWTLRVGFIPITPNGVNYFHGTALAEDRVVCTPWWSPDIVVLDTTNNNTHNVSTGFGSAPAKFQSAIGVGRTAYFPPESVGKIGIFNPYTNVFRTVGSGLPKAHGVVAVGRLLVMNPGFSARFIVFNMDTEAYWTFTDPLIGPGVNTEQGCVLGTKVYFLPSDNIGNVIVFDTGTNQTYHIPSPLRDHGPCALYPPHFLLAPPLRESKSIWLFDAATNVSRMLVDNIPFTTSDSTWWFRGSPYFDNKLVLVPEAAKEYVVVDLRL